MKKPVVILLGKVPPPFMGPAIATQILLNSSLKNRCRLFHVDTRAHHSLDSMGRWSFAKLFRTLFIYTRLKWMILRHWPDLVVIPVSQSTMGFLKDSLYLIIAKCLGRRAIFHLRGSNFRNWYEHSSQLTRWYVRVMLRCTNGVIVQGQKLRAIFHGLVPENHIHVVPNGADYPFHPNSKSNQPLRVLYLANLQASKGIEDLIEAVRVLKNEVPEGFEVDVVGSWRSEETKRACLDMVDTYQLPIVFHPAASGDVKFKFFQNADVFVFTPREPEGHPWVIVEAQAAGLPIIATNQGAIAEAVNDGVNGFLVGVKRPDEIASRLKEFIQNESLRRKLAEASRTTYLNNFTEEKMVEKMMSAIHAVLMK